MDGRIALSQKKLSQAHVLNRLITDKSLTIAQAAEVMGISERHTTRLKGEFKRFGANALVHKRIGVSPSHAISEATRQEIVALKSMKLFEKANFSHYREILAREPYNIRISYSALYNLLTEAGFKSPKTRRQAKKHRIRKRKAREGIMLQMDASPFDWLNIGDNYSIHGAIDDATGKITALYMCKHECLQGYLEVMRTTIQDNGIPVSLYADRHAIFTSPKDGQLTVEEQLDGVVIQDTQFGRAVRELGITLIKARSPQAKGRIERLWETLQSRLPVEFALTGIQTIDEANRFLARYIPKYNERFSAEPDEYELAYRELSPAIRLENVLCVIHYRKFDHGGVFSYGNHSFKIVFDERERIAPHRGSVQVLISPVFGVRVRYAGIVYETIPCIKPIKGTVPKTDKPRMKYAPSDTHYYKYGHTLFQKVTFEEDNYAILKMLERIFLHKMVA